MRRLPLLALVCVLAGCGGGDKKDAALGAKPAPSATPPASGQGADRGEPIIRGWADAVRRSDIDRAATFFTVPVVVSQGQELRLASVARIKAFNDALPCGAELSGVERDGRYTVGTFTLVERPGKTCDGPGNTAQVAFVFKGDRISEWRQVLAPPEPPADAEAA